MATETLSIALRGQTLQVTRIVNGKRQWLGNIRSGGSVPAWVAKLTKNEKEYLTLCLTAIEAGSEDPQGDARILMEATASIDRISDLLHHEGYYGALSTGYIDGIRDRAMALVQSCDHILNRHSRMSELPVVVLDRDPSMLDHSTKNG